MRRWSKEELEICIKLIKSGNSYYDISLIIPRTERSIREKLRLNGYKYIDFYDYEKNKEIVNCLECDTEIKSYIKENRRFCNRSCSKSYNNKHKMNYDFHEKRRIIRKCLNCESIIKTKKKYCNSECNISHKQSVLFEKIENGVTDLPNRNYKKYLINKYGNKCMMCGWNEIHKITGNVPIQLEHKDGDSKNNDLSNLELLCPNCHSLTPTYGSLNSGKSTRSERNEYRKHLRKLTIDELIEEKQKEIKNK